MTKQLITPELANEWIAAYFYEKPLMHSVMRNIRESHVNYLAEEMTRGMFGSATIAFADCKENGRRFIVNGNHTLRAIVKSGVTLYLTNEINECDTMEQVRHLYATYDKNLLRSRADSLRAYHADDTLNILQTDVKVLASAVSFMFQVFGGAHYRRMPDSLVLEEMKEWATPYGHLLVAIGRGKPWFNRIAKRSVLTVALVSMRHQRAMAFPFWQSVVTGAGLARHAPALRLRDYLLEANIRGQGNDALDMAKAVAYCWNKHYNNERIVQMKVPYDKPLEIAGAPKSLTERKVQEPVTSRATSVAVPA